MARGNKMRPARGRNGSGQTANQYTTCRRVRKAWRPVVEPRRFRETRAEFDAFAKSTGRAFAAAWWVAVVVTVVGMAMFGWGC